MQRKISATGTYRLPLYYRYLNTLEKQGRDFVRSKEIGKATGQTDAQVRRDLTCFDSLGTPGKGYDVRELKRMLMTVLGKEKIRNVILVGVGNLGSALLGYKGFRLHYNIVAAFDNDIKKIGGKVGNVEVYDFLHL